MAYKICNKNFISLYNYTTYIGQCTFRCKCKKNIEELFQSLMLNENNLIEDAFLQGSYNGSAR